MALKIVKNTPLNKYRICINGGENRELAEADLEVN
jgi:hypothetical protein